MTTSIENGNVLVVKTDIEKVMFEKRATDLVVRDEDGNDRFFVGVNECDPSIGEFGIICNTVIDGKLAVTMVLPSMEPTTDDVKKIFGPALVKIAEYMPQAVAQLTEEVAAIDGIFE